MKIDMDNLPPIIGYNVKELEFWKLKFSDNARHCHIFHKMVRDGVQINGQLQLERGIPRFYIKIAVEDLPSAISVWLTPEFEKFLLCYLFTGHNEGFPTYLKPLEIPKPNPDSDYFYKHIKRELERDAAIFRNEEQDGVKGTHVMAKYPFGSIDYGFFPLTQADLLVTLASTTPYVYSFVATTIPDLQNNKLPIEERDIAAGQHLDAVFKEIPTNTIIDKTICGVGATWLEIHSERNSIIIEPNVPVIIGKEQQHPNIIGVYGETMSAAMVKQRISEQTGPIKLMTTPDSYPKVINALKQLRIPYLQDYFLLFDECEKIVAEVDYRQHITLPIDDFFKFTHKAMVSATPIVIDDPRFEEQEFKIIKIRPTYDYSKELELKPTNNVEVMLKQTLNSLNTEDTPICIFYNSVQGIKELIDSFKIGDYTNVYCSTEAQRELHKEGYKAFDSVTDKSGKTVLNKYNFFTSRFYSAVDITLDYKPAVIMITQVYKVLPNQTPYSLIDPETEAIQIVGRFRNGTGKITHITNTNSKMICKDKTELETFLREEHAGFHKLLDLRKTLTTQGEICVLDQAIERVEYKRLGFVTDKGEINYFRYNNAYLDERLKMLYRYPAILHKAYCRSGAFKVVSKAEYAAYTDNDRKVLDDKTRLKSERITLLFSIFSRICLSSKSYDIEFLKELQREYALYYDAYNMIGLRKVRELNFVDSDVRTEIKRVKFLKQATDESVINEVYAAFAPNTVYKTSEINSKMKAIFDSYSIEYDRRGVGNSIMLYFEATEARTGTKRTWKLGAKKFQSVT